MDDARRAAMVSYLLLALVALFWSGNVVFGRSVMDELPPFGLNFWRWAGALALMLPFTWRMFLTHRAAIRRDWKMLSLQGFLGITCFNSFAYVAFQTTTAINASLINTLMPIMVIALVIVGFRETMGPRRAIGLVVSFAGTLVILTRGDAAVLRDLAFTKGDLWMLTGAFAYALYTVLLRFKTPELEGVAFLAVISAFGLVITLPVYLAETVLGSPMPLNATSVGMVAYVALFASVLGYIFWNRGVAAVGAGRASLFLHLMPVFTSVMAIGFLDERLRLFHAVGMALVFGGLLLACDPAVTTCPESRFLEGALRSVSPMPSELAGDNTLSFMAGVLSRAVTAT